MEKKKVVMGSGLVVLAAVLWGLDGVVLTPRLYNLPVPFVVFIIHMVPFLLMNLFLWKEYKNIKKFTKKDMAALVLVAVFGGAIGTLAIVKALFLVNFQKLTIIVFLQKLQPVFAIILAKILLKEKTGKNFIPWTAAALAAAYLLTFGFTLPAASGSNFLLASMYSILAAFAFGSATVFGKLAVSRFSFTTATFYRYGLTTFFMAVLLGVTGGFIPFSNVTNENWLIIMIIALTTGAGAIAIYYYGLKHINAHLSTICELAFPLSTVIFDYLINKTALLLTQWLGAVMLIVSIIAISKNQLAVK